MPRRRFFTINRIVGILLALWGVSIFALRFFGTPDSRGVTAMEAAGSTYGASVIGLVLIGTGIYLSLKG